MSRSIDDCFTLLANFIQAAGYEYDDQLYVTRVSKPMPVVADKPVSKRFMPPIIDEVQEHMRLKGCVNNYDEANKFIDFYSSKGWMVGKNKMKCWKSAATNWVKRNHEEEAAKPKRNSFMALGRGDHLSQVNPSDRATNENTAALDQFNQLMIEAKQ